MHIEDILSFFFQNIFFLIIVFLALSQFFRKKTTTGSEEEQQKPKTSPLPPVARPFFDEWFAQEEEKATGEEMQVNSEGVEPSAFEEELSVSIQEKSVEDEDLEIQLPLPPLMETEEQQPAYENTELKKAYKTFRKPSQREVVQGIIWSEILGPPRAKRKYTYRM